MPQTHFATLNRCVGWLLQEEHKQKAHKLRKEVEKAFTEHPELTGETYLQHLAFTGRMSLRLIFIGGSLITHGLFPFLFTRTASGEIERIYVTMKSRVHTAPRKSSIKNILNFRAPKNPAQVETPRIAIVGCGFSGNMVLANLIRTLDTHATIDVYDESTAPASGVAYCTNDNVHLLNVRADRMGAFSGDAEGFYLWLQSEEGIAAASRLWPDNEIKPETFVPRIVYGAYLKSIHEETLRIAREKSIDVNIVQAQVKGARLYNNETQQLILSVSKGGIIKETLVDAMVLATGNLPPRSFNFQHGIIREAENYIGNIWNRKDDSFLQKLSQLPADSEIVIIGTGLTMIDSLLTIKKHGFKGTITAISRHGWLPAAHAKTTPYPLWEWTASPGHAPNTAIAMLKRLRMEIHKAAKEGYDWRSVIDSLRPVTQQLWQKLTVTQKRKFMSRLFTLWNIHRHRMAPEICATVKEMKQSGMLKIIPGSIYYVGSDEQGLTVAYRKRSVNRVETIRAALVINCTGPAFDIATSQHDLLRSMRDNKLLTVGPLRIGVEINPSGSARGNAPASIYPIGTLLAGELLECTAVPELREQALTTSISVTNRLKQLYDKQDIRDMVMGAWI